MSEVVVLSGAAEDVRATTGTGHWIIYHTYGTYTQLIHSNTSIHTYNTRETDQELQTIDNLFSLLRAKNFRSLAATAARDFGIEERFVLKRGRWKRGLTFD